MPEGTKWRKIWDCSSAEVACHFIFFGSFSGRVWWMGLWVPTRAHAEVAHLGVDFSFGLRIINQDLSHVGLALFRLADISAWPIPLSSTILSPHHSDPSLRPLFPLFTTSKPLSWLGHGFVSPSATLFVSIWWLSYIFCGYLVVPYSRHCF